MNINTNLRMNTVRIVSGLAIGLVASPSLGQVAPPPTKPAQEQPEYTPPAPVSAPKPQATPKPTPPNPKPAINARPRDRGDIKDLPIDVPYPKLAQPGPDGRILRLRQLPDIAALRSNPNVGPKSVEKIMPIVYSRRYRMELMVIDNLDLYWELTGGLLDTINMSNIDEMSRAAEMIRPLVGETTLSQELLNRGILTRVQGGMNQYIVREYKKAITDEIQVLDGENGIEEVMRFILKDSIHEATNTYEAMLAEAISQISGLIDETGAASPQADALRAYEKSLNEIDPGQQFEDLMAFDAEFRKLPFEEAIAIFKAMRERREFPSISPTVKTIDVLHDRKTVMEGGFDVQAKDKSGQKVDIKRQQEKNNQPEPEPTSEED